MKNYIVCLFAMCFLFSCVKNETSKILEPSVFEKRMDDKLYPLEGHIFDQNYPNETFAYKAHRKALREVKKTQSSGQSRQGEWINEGPGNIGGRINTIGVNPNNSNEMMFGYSFGGIFKTTDNGASWIPIFDDQDILSISDITYDPINPSTIYVSTGDLNISGYPTTGNGVYKSIDSGTTWAKSGLTEAGVIAEIGMANNDSETLYAATMGLPFERNDDRGLYKSTNSGQDWEKVLFLNDSTGIIDIEVHPTNSDIVYAASWTRIRNNRESTLEGTEVGIFKTVDGGQNWTRLENGLPSSRLVRPGLSLFPDNPDILYTSFVHYVTEDDTTCTPGYHIEGIYKTIDGGDSWTEIPTTEDTGLPCRVLGGFGWYFGQIRVNPLNSDEIYLLGVDMYKTYTNGEFWEIAVPPWWTYEVHADKHDMVFNEAEIILATDGGAYRGNSFFYDQWEDMENIISTQFYRVALNPFAPGQYYGGAQDNGSTGGNVTNKDEWPRIFGGDGFQMIFHPTNPDIHYVETQNGAIRYTDNGGENYQNGTAGLNGSRNWDMQYIMSNHNPSMTYTGTDKMFRSVSDSMPMWEAISGILTDTLDESSAFSHTISTLDESPLDPAILYCGVSDGFVWRSLDGGLEWEQINGDLPRRYISDIKASPTDLNTVYLSIQGYKDNDYTPYIYKSTDNGSNWEHIQGDMPQIAINDILVHSEMIFLGTDGGVYMTKNDGENWERLGDNMPIMPIYDLALEQVDGDQILVAGSFARGIYTYDLSQLIDTDVDDEGISYSIKVFPTITADFINIDINTNEKTSWKIISIDGKIIKKGNQVDAPINISDLNAGTYFVLITSGQKQIGMEKVVKI